MWKWLLGFLRGLAKDWVLKPLASATSILFMWGFHALVRASPGRAFELMKRISASYFTPPEEWAGFIAAYMEQMTGAKISIEDIIAGGASGAGRAATEKLGEAFVTPLLNLIMPEPPITPKDGVDAAERYLGVNLQFQMSAWFLHVLGDMQSFGIFKSLKDLPNAISWSFGLGWLSWLVMGTPFQMGISDPLREHFNRVYKPERFSVAQNTEALQKGLITAQEFVDNMRFLGWTDDRIQILYQLAKKDPSEANLKKLYNLGILTEEEVKREVKARGYSDAWTNLLTQLITRDREVDQRDKLLSELENLFVNGVVDESIIRDGYSRAGWKEREIELAIQKLEAEKTRRSQLSNTDIANAVEKDLMAWSEGREILMRRGFSRKDAEIFMKLRIPEGKWLT
jgi:hypothetical protein